MANPMDEIRRDLFGEATPGQRAKQLLEQNVVLAAANIVDLAMNSSNERIRLTANQAILDRVVGPVGRDEQQDSLVDFLQGIQALAARDSTHS
jgi:hypothetical protein